MADVDADHVRRVVLQEAIGEAARGLADIQATLAAHVDACRRQRAFELQAAARDIGGGARTDREHRVPRDELARLRRLDAADAHRAAADQVGCARPRGGQATIHQ